MATLQDGMKEPRPDCSRDCTNLESQWDDNGRLKDCDLAGETGQNTHSAFLGSSQGPTSDYLKSKHNLAAVEAKDQVHIAGTEDRGFLTKFVLLPMVGEPRRYPEKLKWTITAIVSLAGALETLGSSIILPSLSDIAQDLKTTTATTTFSVGVYSLALGIFPLFWSSFCESSGRRPIYLVSFGLMVISYILAALSRSIAMFIIMRFLSGVSAASLQTVGSGTLADIWHISQRGRAMGFFYLGPLCGPLLAPIIGGLLQTKWYWRSTMWFMSIVAFVAWNLLFWGLPETLTRTKSLMTEVKENLTAQTSVEKTEISDSPTISNRESDIPKSRVYTMLLRRVFWEPLTTLRYFRFPAISLAVFYASITWGSVFVLQISIQITFSRSPYNYAPLQIGLLYLSSSIGSIVASILGGRWIDKIMLREAKKAERYDENGELIYKPEDRVRENAWLAAVLYPLALIWYGWTADKGIHVVVPLSATFLFGLGSMLVFTMLTTILTELMPHRASSGVALNNLFPNIFAFIGSVTAEPLINAIGTGWLFTAVGLIALMSGIAVWSLRRYGSYWRNVMEAEMED